MTTPQAAIPDQFQAAGFRFVKLGSSGELLKRPVEYFWECLTLEEAKKKYNEELAAFHATRQFRPPKKLLAGEPSRLTNYAFDDPGLLQHLQRGLNFGIINGTGPSGAGLVTLDADNLPRLAELVDLSKLPPTLEAGRRGEDGEPIPDRRHFHFLSDLGGKHLLRDPETGEDLGDIRGTGGYQVVGPGSLHPSGARVEVLEDRPLATISGAVLRRILAPVLEEKPKTDRARLEEATKKRPPTATDRDPFADVSILDVIDVSGFKESGGQLFGPHPVHGSETGHNLVVNPSKNSWWCGRCETGGGPALWLAVEGEILRCEEARGGALRGERFLRVLDYARARGIIPADGRGESSPEEGDDKADEAGGAGMSRGQSMATRIVDLALSSGAMFWRTTEGEPFATIPAGDHTENHSLRSKAFKTWLSGLLYEAEGRAPKGSAAADALAVLEGRAIFGEEVHPVYVRLAECGGRFYLDLGGDDWRAAEIDSSGWRVISSEAVPVKFRRSKGGMALPEPTRGGSLEDLRRVLNVPEGAPWVLVRAWLVQAFNPTGPYPVLIVDGEQGSGKSWLGRILRYLIDPNKSPLRRPPRNEHDLMISAANSWLSVFDNLSGLPGWLGDALCVVSTGGGLSCRELYTDSEEALFDLQRPIVLNGIDALTTRGDLLGRAIVLHLPRIKDEDRMTEKVMLAELDRIRPGVLGAVLDVVSSGLRELPNVELPSKPRMADFAEWVTACEGGLGLEPGEFMAAFEANRTEAEASLIGADFFATSLVEFIESGTGPFEGTASFLLAALEERAGITPRGRPDGWPRTPQGAGNKIRRLAPALRAVGIEVSYRIGHGNVTLITIQRHKTTKTTKTTVSSGAKSISSGSSGGDGGLGGLHSATLPSIPSGGLLHPLPNSDPKVKKIKELEEGEERDGEGEVRKQSPPRPPRPPDNGFSGGLGGLGGLCDELAEARRREAEHMEHFTTPELDGRGEGPRPKKDGSSPSVGYSAAKKEADRSTTKKADEEEGRAPTAEEAEGLATVAAGILENWPGLPEMKLWEMARARLGKPLPLAVVRRWLKEAGYIEAAARLNGSPLWNPPPSSEGVTA